MTSLVVDTTPLGSKENPLPYPKDLTKRQKGLWYNYKKGLRYFDGNKISDREKRNKKVRKTRKDKWNSLTKEEKEEDRKKRNERSKISYYKCKERARKKIEKDNLKKLFESNLNYTNKSKEIELVKKNIINRKNYFKAQEEINHLKSNLKKLINDRKKIYKKIYMKWYRQSPKFRLAQSQRNRVTSALKNQNASKNERTMEYVNCSVAQLYNHLESQFGDSGMTWNNMGRDDGEGGRGWEVDHRRPCASFDLNDEEQKYMCFHWTNLQPMWGKENSKKLNSYNPKTFRYKWMGREIGWVGIPSYCKL